MSQCESDNLLLEENDAEAEVEVEKKEEIVGKESEGEMEEVEGEIKQEGGEEHETLQTDNSAKSPETLVIKPLYTDQLLVDVDPDVLSHAAKECENNAEFPNSLNEVNNQTNNLKNEFSSNQAKNSFARQPNRRRNHGPAVAKAKAHIEKSRQKVLDWLDKRGNFLSNVNDNWGIWGNRESSNANEAAKPFDLNEFDEDDSKNNKPVTSAVKSKSAVKGESTVSVKKVQSQRFADEHLEISVSKDSFASEDGGSEPEGTWEEGMAPHGMSVRTMNIIVALFGVLTAIAGIILIVFYHERPHYEKIGDINGD